MKKLSYSKELLAEAVSNSVSFAGVLRYLGLRQAGGTQAHIARKIRQYEIDYSHFTMQGHNKGKPALNKKTAEEILILADEFAPRAKRLQLLRALTECNVPYACKECGILPVWNNQPLTLEIDHINGNFWDNRLENLRFLCPNCHSQQAGTNKPRKYRGVKGEIAK